MLTYFRARTKDFGSAFVRLSASFQSGTNSATDTYTLGGIADLNDTAAKPGHTAYVDEIIISSVILAASASAVTGAIKKYDSSAGAAVTLASSINMKGLTAGKAARIAFDSGVTDSQRIIDFGDTIYFESVQAGTLTTQPSTNVAVLIKLLT